MKSIPHGALLWRCLYAVTRPFASQAVVARDVRKRSRQEFVADLVDDGVGPHATVAGRDATLYLLSGAVPVTVVGVYLVVLGLALVLRPVLGSDVAGDVLAVVAACLMPFLFLVLPFSARFAVARRQLHAWQRRGEPQDERPTDSSLPAVWDTALGFAAGAVFGGMIVAGLVVG